ncbi:MAG TPA: hypothetical protein VFD06_09720 [Candidatus Polarisedimenticolia bacterium]|nr:hypothetical protein [Candidatus Polarisedimenticolia bacterium]
MPKRPTYAASIPPGLLVRVLCRGDCQALRYAEVSKYPWTPNDPELYATCLKCGYQARDSYNWGRKRERPERPE